MKVWLAGAGGMLGQAIEHQLRAQNVTYLATHRRRHGSAHEGVNVESGADVVSFAHTHRPTHVINCAAYTRVDDAEVDPQAAFRANADGPEHLAKAARYVGAAFLHFSTDYVFPGYHRANPYDEHVRTQPDGVYARSKDEGERRLFRLYMDGGTYHIIRTSWLFGPGGKNFVDTMLGLMRDRQSLGVVADQLGRPTYTRDLAQVALELMGVARGTPVPSGVYHFANAGAVSWHAFAEKIRQVALELGHELIVKDPKQISAITTAQFPRPAPRPSYSVLSTDKIERELGRTPRSYEEALREHLAPE